jgi:hypothetical protein
MQAFGGGATVPFHQRRCADSHAFDINQVLYKQGAGHDWRTLAHLDKSADEKKPPREGGFLIAGFGEADTCTSSVDALTCPNITHTCAIAQMRYCRECALFVA